jgi:malate/lactate dehydrogenase
MTERGAMKVTIIGPGKVGMVLAYTLVLRAYILGEHGEHQFPA